MTATRHTTRAPETGRFKADDETSRALQALARISHPSPVAAAIGVSRERFDELQRARAEAAQAARTADPLGYTPTRR